MAGVLADVAACHARRHPGKRPTPASRLVTALTSRGLVVLAVHRLNHAHSRWNPRLKLLGAVTGGALAVARYVTSVMTKSQIRRYSAIAPGVFISDAGHIVIGAESIGAGTVIHDRVTIGKRAGDPGMPVVGRRVWMGAWSVVYGNIRIGDGVTILPGTVVSRSIPDRAVVAGNPGVIIRRDFDNSVLLDGGSTDVLSGFLQG